MASLSAHLRQPEAHGRLPFHADCPVCRAERLVGSFEPSGLVSSRAPAALAAGVLAFSAVAPPAFAADGDSQQEGSATVTQSGGADSAEDPDFDPGGSSEDLAAQAPALPQAPASSADGSDDTGAIDEQPAADTNDPVVDPGDGSDQQNPLPQPAAATATVAPSASTMGSAQPPAQSPAAQPSPTAQASPAPTVAGSEAVVPKSTTASRARNLRAPRHRKGPTSRGSTVRSRTANRTAVAKPLQATPAAQAPAPRPVVSAPAVPRVRAADRARPGDRTHSVVAGESLWSIASDLLGGGASPARVAREVNRVWELNRERIGTGNPDLLMVGTTLRLP